MNGRAWHGDWLIRIYQCVRARGFMSVTAFAKAYPAATLLELAEQLGDGVAAVQIESALRVEAQEAKELEEFARDSLVRHVRDNLPMGWDDDEQFDFERSGVYVNWRASLKELLDTTACQALVESLKNADIPRGWLPNGPDDLVIERIFAGIPIQNPVRDSQIGMIGGLGRPWPGDWDMVVMGELQTLEQRLGRRLQPDEIMEVVRALMKKYDIDKPFQPVSGASHE